MTNDLRIVATGDKWIGYGVRSFSSIIDEIVRDVKKEVVMTIYVITDKNIVDSIQGILERGISVEIFIYAPDKPDENKAYCRLMELEKEYRYLSINRVNEEVLHAKILIADGERILVGSANPTFHGMVKNYELGFLVEDGKVAQKILTMLRRLPE